LISEDKIKNIIAEVLGSMGAGDQATGSQAASAPEACEELCDLTAVDLKKELLVPEPCNREAYLKMKETTPARIGIWRAGPRPLTRSLLRFRADHAVAQDAVFSNVSDEFVESMGLFQITSSCKDKDHFLTRPDLGRKLDDETIALLKEKCTLSPRVQIYIADGLSSTAIETNAKDAYNAIVQGLKGHGIETGTPFFLKYGRVPAMDVISEVLTPEVTVLLIGERPGLATGESMSCYMAYKASTTMPEANRTVISNIHKGGTPAVEAGAHIADIVKTMLEQKASGLDLKL